MAVAEPATTAGGQATTEENAEDKFVLTVFDKIIGTMLTLVWISGFASAGFVWSEASRLEETIQSKRDTSRQSLREFFDKQVNGLQTLTESRFHELEAHRRRLADRKERHLDEWTGTCGAVHTKLAEIERRIEILQKGKP